MTTNKLEDASIPRPHHLFVQAEGVLSLVDDAAAGATGRSLVLVTGEGITNGLGSALVAFRLDVATRNQ